MSFCPKCGHYEPDPVPRGIEETLGRCPVCKRNRIGDDLRVEACSLGYNVHCLTCGLSTGYSHELGDALSDWEAVVGKGMGKEMKPAVVDPSYIRRRVDAESLIEAIKAGLQLMDGGECKVGGLWVFRDDPLLPDEGQPGVIRISTEEPESIKEEEE